MHALYSGNGTQSVPPQAREGSDGFRTWQSCVRRTVLDEVAGFVAARRAAELDHAGIEAAGEILVEFVSGGKCVRSTFMYLGWLCGAAPVRAALRASASLELLHAFALLQDDVMDDSSVRRGRPAAHLQLARWHRESGLSGSAQRFGESAAMLLGDLCLIWAEQMLRESGVEPGALKRAWPRYDAMRTELALGQFADLTSDVRQLPSLETVLDVARRKSGNYTVRRPLEIGAAMADCSGDLLERKATSVVVAAHQMADAPTRREFDRLMTSDRLDDGALERWRSLIVSTGAAQWIEEMIGDRVASARNDLCDLEIDDSVRTALAGMAAACTERSE
jgi:geranylgeranyl diphosphate synthase type I